MYPAEPTGLKVTGSLVVNGQDISERLANIEIVLGMPERDPALEEKHPVLKKMYDDYIRALARYRTFEAIKGEDNDPDQQGT
jgi:hypothetical protein